MASTHPKPAAAAFIEARAQARLPTRFGTFTLWGFWDSREDKEHTVLLKGDVAGLRGCPVRIHSECHTGDVWGSLRCDCREQLEASLQYLSTRACGVIIYLRQEGRGIGLFNKLEAYRLQDEGLDTVDANLVLGLPADARNYEAAAAIIRHLRIASVRLMTNNPEKIRGLRREGIRISGRIPLIIHPNAYNAGYLLTKKVRMGHLL